MHEKRMAWYEGGECHVNNSLKYVNITENK